MIARDPRQTWTYVFASELALLKEGKIQREDVTVHKLKHLSLFDEHSTGDDLEYDFAGGTYRRRNLGTQLLASLRKGYAGCDNLKDAEGNVIAFEADKAGVVTDEFLMRFTLNQRLELGRAIENELVVTPEELSKSTGARAPGVGQGSGEVPALSAA